jgi:flagellar motor switch protein FliN
MPDDMELTELTESSESGGARTVRELEAVYDIPVTVSAVLGKTTMQVSQLLKLVHRFHETNLLRGDSI